MVQFNNVGLVYCFILNVELVGLHVVAGGLYQVQNIEYKVNTFFSYFEKMAARQTHQAVGPNLR